jgi:cytochrome c peroxidase
MRPIGVILGFRSEGQSDAMVIIHRARSVSRVLLQCVAGLAALCVAAVLLNAPAVAAPTDAPTDATVTKAAYKPAVPSPMEAAATKASYKRPNTVPYPRDNPFSEAKVSLGQMLFFDPRVSGPGTMSCSSCHNPGLSWGDRLPTAVGSAANHLGRRSPTILNLAWADALFWDGRADTLEQQALGPMMAPGEMNQTMPHLVSLLTGMPGYRDAFGIAFPGESISDKTIAKAVATFERTVVSAEAPFDRWVNGQENAIDESAKRGFALFNGEANCSACHSGWRFTDDSFHDIGLSDADLGRGKVIQGVEPLQHAFKTPGLRNIASRAPFMHNGSIATLSDVIRHYDHGFIQRASLSTEIYKLNLTEPQIADLVALLKTLSSNDATFKVPVLPVADAN